MLYVFDTDHISLLQNHQPHLLAYIKKIPATQRTVTIVTLFEQLQGRLAVLNRAKNETEAAHAFQRLFQTVEYYRPLLILAYSPAAVVEYERLRKQKIRIGTQDLRIAAIALSEKATVVTRNSGDFRQVPGLLIEDWSQPVA